MYARTRAPIHIIAAVSEIDFVIGRNTPSKHLAVPTQGELLWRIKADMEHFKTRTMGGACVMGRTTWESIPRHFRPLEGRTNLVLTHSQTLDPPQGPQGQYGEVVLMRSESGFLTQDLWNLALSSPVPVWICGGASLYEAALPIADSMWLSWINPLDHHIRPEDVQEHLPEDACENLGKGVIKPTGHEVYFPRFDRNDWHREQQTRVAQGLNIEHLIRKRPLVIPSRVPLVF